MGHTRLNALGSRLQIEQGAATGGARDELGLRHAQPGCMQDIVAETNGLSSREVAFDLQAIAEAITQLCPQPYRPLEQGFGTASEIRCCPMQRPTAPASFEMCRQE